MLRAFQSLNPFRTKDGLTVEVIDEKEDVVTSKRPPVHSSSLSREVMPVPGKKKRHVRHTTEVDLSTAPLVPPAPPATHLVGDKTKEVSLSILKPIGNGAFGVVYIAHMGEAKEVVAVKKVLQDRRYKNRELQIISDLHHPNIVSLLCSFYSTESKDDSVYLNLVLEYIPDNLHKVIKSTMKGEAPLSELTVKLYMYQLCRSLVYLHGMGICHRDLKPQNILVDQVTKVLKLCDFGSAKKLTASEANVSYICSRYYRAPELIFGATDYTTAIDMWSVGCVCVELVLGEPLFAGENAIDQLSEIIKVLGTPSRGEILEMNKMNSRSDFEFPAVQKMPLEKLLPSSSSLLLDFVSKLLTYRPSQRLDPLMALAHPFFDELRNPATTLPDRRPLPPLFNFLPQELALNPSLAAVLVPEHARTEVNWPVDDVISKSREEKSFPPELYKLPHPFEVIADTMSMKAA